MFTPETSGPLFEHSRNSYWITNQHLTSNMQITFVDTILLCTLLALGTWMLSIKIGEKSIPNAPLVGWHFHYEPRFVANLRFFLNPQAILDEGRQANELMEGIQGLLEALDGPFSCSRRPPPIRVPISSGHRNLYAPHHSTASDNNNTHMGQISGTHRLLPP